MDNPKRSASDMLSWMVSPRWISSPSRSEKLSRNRWEKTGKTYDAAVVLEDDGQYANFKLEFDQRKGGS